MALLLLANTVRAATHQLRVTDDSDTATTDNAGAEATVGGPRHLFWQQSGTGARRIALINKAGGLSADYFVGVNMHRHLTHDVKLRSWTSYAGTGANAFSSTNFAETLIGMTGRDLVYPLGSLTGKVAFGLCLDSGTGGAYQKTVNPFYFSQSYSFSKQDGNVVRQLKSIHDSQLKYWDHWYHLDSIATFTLSSLTRAQVDSYRLLDKRDPVFLYDSTGDFLDQKLWHGIILSENISLRSNDQYQLSMQFGILRHWT